MGCTTPMGVKERGEGDHRGIWTLTMSFKVTRPSGGQILRRSDPTSSTIEGQPTGSDHRTDWVVQDESEMVDGFL